MSAKNFPRAAAQRSIFWTAAVLMGMLALAAGILLGVLFAIRAGADLALKKLDEG